jgi:hypothetical protein
LSSDHFSVDGTLLEAWASMKSFVPKDGSGDPPSPGRNGERNFHKEKRSNETHASTTDPDARLFRKSNGQESRLAYLGHTLMENRNGLIVQAEVTRATGTAERDAALVMIDRHKPAHRITLGADKLFDAESFVTELRQRGITPHIAVNGAISKLGKARRTLIDARTTHHPGYDISQRASAGSRPSPGNARSSFGASPGSMASSSWAWPPTISSASRNCWRPYKQLEHQASSRSNIKQ